MMEQADRSAWSFLISTVTDLSCHSALISNKGVCRDKVNSGNRKDGRWDCHSISYIKDLHMI